MNVSLRQDHASGFWKRTFLFLLSHMTNAHTKRIFFLTTLYCRVREHGLDDLREDVINQLNDMLRLARRTEALRLPALFQGMVWTDDVIDAQIRQEMSRKEFDPAMAHEISVQLVDSSVPGLRYGERDVMVNDVTDLLRGIFNASHAPQPAQA